MQPKPVFIAILILLSAACNKEKPDLPKANIQTTLLPGKTNAIPAQSKYKKVLILGNSITYSPINESIGWNNACGMAATSPDLDYVHLLWVHFKFAKLTAVNISQFEREYQTYEPDQYLKEYRDLKPDLIIMRIGENLPMIDSALFRQKYKSLLNYLRSNNPDVKVIAGLSFWPDRDDADNIIKQYSPYVKLNVLSGDISNYAFGLYTDGGVQQHPSDKGMKGIADLLWGGITKLK
jgi:lysophospholipase L1-like esterase